MSECVVRMKMPHDGLCDLAFSLLDRTCCTIEGDLCNYCDDGVIPKWCPILCQLPEGHGRLVDEKEVKDWVENWLCVNKYYHPYSSSKSIPVSELYDVLQRMDATVPADTEERMKTV